MLSARGKTYKVSVDSVHSFPKKGIEKLRMILDLSLLNKCIHCPTFKMLSHKQVRLSLPRGVFTKSIDLQDGYWHIPIAPKKRHYIGFSYAG